MTIYDWIVTYILPMFGDPSAVEGAVETFGNIFWLVVACCVVHFCVYVPYRLILHYLKWRQWKK